MVRQEGSRTLILVCRRAFSRIVERVLRHEGFSHFQRGRLSLVGGAAVGPEGGEVASEVFVLVTEVSSANRLAEILRACPIRGNATGLFELYTIDQGL